MYVKKEVLDRFFEELERNGKAVVTYTIPVKENYGVFTLSDGEKVKTKTYGFTAVARAFKDAVEKRYGTLSHTESIGFRGDVYDNENVTLTLEAGWGVLWIEARRK